ncbi:unnamed protein product, partial [Prorocentrum cordatum]
GREAALPAATEAAAHALLDIAKGDQWDDLFRRLDARPELVNIRPEVRQFSLLHQAVYMGRAWAVARLLDEYGADPAQRTKAGEPCSSIAEARASPEIAALIAAHTGTAAAAASAEAPADLTPEKVCKKAAEAAASVGEEGALEAAHALIDLARDASWSELFAALDKRRELVDVRPSVREYNVLHQAAYHGDVDALCALIDRYGADPAARTKSGLSAEEVARAQGHARAADDLRRRAQGSSGTGAAGDAHAGLADLAKDSRWPELFRALDASGDLVNVRPDVREFSVLHQAAYHGEREVVAALLDRYGADPAARSRSGRSAADVAEERGHEELARELRAKLQDPDEDCDLVQNADGSWTVVQRAAASEGGKGGGPSQRAAAPRLPPAAALWPRGGPLLGPAHAEPTGRELRGGGGRKAGESSLRQWGPRGLAPAVRLIRAHPRWGHRMHGGG